MAPSHQHLKPCNEARTPMVMQTGSKTKKKQALSQLLRLIKKTAPSPAMKTGVVTLLAGGSHLSTMP